MPTPEYHFTSDDGGHTWVQNPKGTEGQHSLTVTDEFGRSITIFYDVGLFGYVALARDLFQNVYPDFQIGVLTVEHQDGPRDGAKVILECVGTITSFDLGRMIEGKPPLPHN